MRTAIDGFVAGALSVATVHQGTVWLMAMAGWVPRGIAWSLGPVPPLGVPFVLNGMFWGGVWGVAIAALLARTQVRALLSGFLVGVFGAALLSLAVVAPLKGGPTFAGGNLPGILRVAFINGAFGWGTALILLTLRRGRRLAHPSLT